jgi:hypothetical protein
MPGKKMKKESSFERLEPEAVKVFPKKILPE